MKDAGSQWSESSWVDVPKQLDRTDIDVTVVRVELEQSEQEYGCRLLVQLSTGDYGWLHDSQMSWWRSSQEAFDEWWERMERLKKEQLATAGNKKKTKRRASEEEAYGARPKRRKRPSRKSTSTRVCGQKDPSGSSEDSSDANGEADELEEAEEDPTPTEHQIEAVDSPSCSQGSSEANGAADELEKAEENAMDHSLDVTDSPSSSEGSSEANGEADELEEAEEDATDHSLDAMDSPSASALSSEANGEADELEEAEEDAAEHQIEATDSPSTDVGEGVDQDEPTDQFASSSGPAEQKDGDEDMEYHHAEVTEAGAMPTCISIATFDYLNEPPGTLLVRAEYVMWGSAKEAAIAKRCKGLEETLQMPFDDSWPIAKRIQAIWKKMIADKYVC